MLQGKWLGLVSRLMLGAVLVLCSSLSLGKDRLVQVGALRLYESLQDIEQTPEKFLQAISESHPQKLDECFEIRQTPSPSFWQRHRRRIRAGAVSGMRWGSGLATAALVVSRIFTWGRSGPWEEQGAGKPASQDARWRTGLCQLSLVGGSMMGVGGCLGAGYGLLTSVMAPWYLDVYRYHAVVRVPVRLDFYRHFAGRYKKLLGRQSGKLRHFYDFLYRVSRIEGVHVVEGRDGLLYVRFVKPRAIESYDEKAAEE